MPWEERTVMQSRLEFVMKIINEEASLSALCREYGISRPTGYKWIERYKQGEALCDKSHAAQIHTNRTPPEIEDMILQVRNSHPTWGKRKILRYLSDRESALLPSASTVGAILKRNGCISHEESLKHIPFKRFQREHPNELWQMDYKGHFAMANGVRCHPLTMTDDCSRKLLCLDAYDNERWESVQNSLFRVFSEYGLPESILSDNGNPWGDNRNGHTQFEVWMMQLDILPIHGRILHPQTQGKEERFHRTLKEDVLKRHSIQDLEDAQRIFDRYKIEFNTERPHEALNLDVPERHYKASERKLPDKWGEPEYDSGRSLRKVNYKGYLSIDRHRYYLGENFIGKNLELVFQPENKVDICYGNFKIAQLDLDERLIISKKIYRREL